MALKPQVIAHRGIHTDGLTENTLAAFQASVDVGADMIELDVRRTAAQELVILHDHGIGKITLDSCSLNDFESRTGFRPPLLTEVLNWADSRIGLDIELKEDGYVADLLPLLTGFAEAGNELIVTSFIDPVLAQLHERAPALELGLLLTWSAEGFVERARACGAGAALPEMKLVNEELIAATQDADLALIVWDFMAAEHSPLLVDQRVHGVITDDVPGALVARS